MATTSETKLEHTAPAENEREKEDWQEEHSMKMPEPPGPKTRGTEPSVQMVSGHKGTKRKGKSWPTRTEQLRGRNGGREAGARGTRKRREGPKEGREGRGQTFRGGNEDQE